MPAPIPKLKSVEVMDRVNAILKDLTAYVPEDNVEIRRLLKDSEASIKVNPALGHAALSVVYQIIGNAEKARYHIDNAIKLAPSEHLLLVNKSSILINLGFYSEALPVYVKSASPESGHMTLAWLQGYVCGAFTTMATHLKKARKMQLDLKGSDVETAERAAAVLEQTGVDERELAGTLDFLGAVLRDHKLFYVGVTPHVVVFNEPDHDPFIRMSYQVAVSPTDSHRIYMEFIERMTTARRTPPSCLSVSVRSHKTQHARQAA
jgi:tetratricopeptide (TPR) repeat protein